MTEKALKILRPKPIKPFFNITRTQSTTLINNIMNPLNFKNTKNKSQIPHGTEEMTKELTRRSFFDNNVPLKKLIDYPFNDEFENMNNASKVERELFSLNNSPSISKSNPYFDIDDIPFRPPNPMVNDELWGSDNSFSTEEENNFERRAVCDIVPDISKVQSL